MPEFGDPYMLEEYTLEDLKQCPILVWVSHETDSGEKPFLTPLLNTRNLSPEFNHAKILLSVVGAEVYAEASYNTVDRSIYSILIWDGDNTVEVEDCELESPISFQTVPEIDGEANVVFVLESKQDYYAYRDETAAGS
ncbi:MAG: hypothetical protein JAY99_11700 [Candidatus Thiodiazotropha lotti]|uniref:Uncharacterized protein n=1 Tax=Candidatus Thiodiazotropha endoloripes TaxID=1818881 RepID=A0A1E2UHX1_9GAMM|nr:hypothetical protein [Candidatus Thiodiazotropha endoloripes]MCG7897276.1 hypothetical protein [Candidatus Thiodiazotropha weberae]MCG7993050.1 hypothetical protein [Candidatus Thiodiazotropha lotti]MCG7902557.1 hypothetical protein [Candidatus Thiodiazotropha weberae]MCG7913591.1 hypothetical protein [Candidatus Thiodiazotropha weberae]MCG8000184.1 hypothetical protein [Candidatus Thiodiazotropha lotti]